LRYAIEVLEEEANKIAGRILARELAKKALGKAVDKSDLRASISDLLAGGMERSGDKDEKNLLELVQATEILRNKERES
jgi:hypothetical protein